MHTQRVGVAGYMGAGKSTFARSFARHGFNIIDADAEAKQMMDTGLNIQHALSKTFGDTVVKQGKVDFKQLGTIVFENRRNLQRLNAIVHPQLRERLQQRMQSPAAGRLVMDAALIPLWHTEEWFEKLFWIRAPASIRLARLSKKLNLDASQIERRMQLQEQLFPEPAGSSWKIIDNHGLLDELEERANREAQLLP